MIIQNKGIVVIRDEKWLDVVIREKILLDVAFRETFFSKAFEMIFGHRRNLLLHY